MVLMSAEVKQHIEAEEYEDAIRLLTLQAEQGDADAQFLLGYLHFTGAAVEPKWAKSWLEKAAAQNHAEACYENFAGSQQGLRGQSMSEMTTNLSYGNCGIIKSTNLWRVTMPPTITSEPTQQEYLEMSPDKFFSEKQILRLRELMERVHRAETPPEDVLSAPEYSELQLLIKAELHASAQRAAALLSKTHA